jgi:CRISPR-associated endonuclease/helicase Cas3
VDISPYVRDLDQAQLQVYWRDFEDRPGEQRQPARDELCPVGIGQCKDYLAVKGRTAWRWDPLTGDWRKMEKEQIRPGLVLLLPARDGGYVPEEGFVPKARNRVEPVPVEGLRAEELYGEDPWSSVGGYVRLEVHLKDVAVEVDRLSAALDLDSATRAVLWEAARWHDVGKAHEAFQRGIRGAASPEDGILWAKAPIQGPPDYHVIDAEGRRVSRRGFRHELASALAWLQHRSSTSTADLAAFLIASHHGKVRMGLRALPIESQPSEEDTLFARGVWQGDRLPPVRVGDFEMPETILRLDLMRLGAGPHGRSWMERTRLLLDELGPFTLAWLEALLRVSDWRGSRNEGEVGEGEAGA